MSDRNRSGLRRHFPSAAFAVAALVVVAGLVGLLAGAGVYNIAADAPHTPPVAWFLAEVRDRSIAVRARDVKPPADFASPQRLARGAGLYDEMCTSCHLAPGMERTEISQGLYPAAPQLALGVAHTPGEEFWIIKHGVKMTAMPAWGRTHSDDLIWDMVSFVRTLPSLSPAQYQAAVRSAPADHDSMMRDMAGMTMKPGRP